jgi:hypothetical protein
MEQHPLKLMEGLLEIILEDPVSPPPPAAAAAAWHAATGSCRQQLTPSRGGCSCTG